MHDSQAKKKETAMLFDNIRNDYKAGLKMSDYPGTMSLVFDLDTPVCVVTTDFQTFIGELSSFDSFGNIVLSRARNRFIYQSGVNDASYGTCYFRTDDIVLIGRIDKDKESEVFQQFKITPPAED
ncbi:SM-like, degradation of cytoplasmic mRNAs and positively regulates transcription initiation [Tritrichomonas musculus]|uniref:SM-like, degradation of cytoplasmic mRNAs and positively regulates transcription initiation n=1 Tax=Tritrichomonas musculus TaxID=1915356 RepID=A0ABR2K9S3_9EUKA